MARSIAAAETKDDWDGSRLYYMLCIYSAACFVAAYQFMTVPLQAMVCPSVPDKDAGYHAQIGRHVKSVSSLLRCYSYEQSYPS
jgi:hypothetical protein